MTDSNFLSRPPIVPIVSFDDIPLAAVTAINEVIKNDEGGWVLSHSQGDNDGGWTYAGMTASSFSRYYGKKLLSDIGVLLDDPEATTQLRQIIIGIYYQDYAQKAQEILGESKNLEGYHLSCVINCGAGGFTTILSNSNLQEISFLKAWCDYYWHLVAGNSANQKWIHGWMNRIMNYVSDPS